MWLQHKFRPAFYAFIKQFGVVLFLGALLALGIGLWKAPFAPLDIIVSYLPFLGSCLASFWLNRRRRSRTWRSVFGLAKLRRQRRQALSSS